MALWGTVLRSLIGGWPTDRFGRKNTLIAIGALYFISAIWSGIATDVNAFMIARFIGGVGVGISTIAAPLYISEIAPPERRGRLTGLFQFNIVFGILVAYLSNYLIGLFMGDSGWRWMLGIEAIPAIVYTAMCFIIPESPRWLIACKGDYDRGVSVLKLVNADASDSKVRSIADEILASNESVTGANSENSLFWSKRMRTPILIAFFVAFFNQLSGINAILYFAPRIFELAGVGKDAALLNSVGIGIINLLFTFAGLYLIDRVGRRTLLYIGSVGYIISLGTCAWVFFAYAKQLQESSAAIDTADKETGSIGLTVLLCIFVFIASHAIGQGAVIWVLISEIFPNRHRANGQALGSFTHWIFAALLTMVFPYMISTFAPGYVFGFFCFMMFLQLLWVRLMVVETKGVSLEQMERQLSLLA